MEASMYMEKFRNAKYVVVHDGMFHVDDVFVVSYVQWARAELGLSPLIVFRNQRSKTNKSLNDGFIVADTGYGEFDHHYKDESLKETRPNGVPYASFGLIVRAFHDGLLTEEEYEYFDENFIQPIDYHDNYGGGNQLSLAISSFNYNWDTSYDEKKNTNKFNEATFVARKILENNISSVRSKIRAYHLAEEQIVKYNTIFMSKRLPIDDVYSRIPGIQFIGYPDRYAGYRISSIKVAGNPKGTLPEEIWANATPDTRIKHNIIYTNFNGTLAIFKTKEDAIRFITTYYKNRKS